MSSMQRGKIFGVLILMVACTARKTPPAPPAPPAIDWKTVTPLIRDRLLEKAREGALARDDGWVYTVDVAQALEAAALLEDEEAYLALISVAGAARVDASTNPFLRGFVAWRSRAGEPPDATGTTEALRLARALWLGADRFGRAEDRREALEILEGYERHQYVDQGVWLIRNYYNLGTDAFATNSYLVDYDPDFVRTVATSEPTFLPLATKVEALVRGAVTDSGFVHELVQPEVLTAMPRLGTAVFSPNNRAQLSNSCAVLERSLESERLAAEKLLRFAHARAEDLRLIYDVTTGEVHPNGRPGVETFGCLTRLAAALNQRELAAPFASKLSWYIRDFLENEPQPFAFVASELLLTAARSGSLP